MKHSDKKRQSNIDRLTLSRPSIIYCLVLAVVGVLFGYFLFKEVSDKWVSVVIRSIFLSVAIFLVAILAAWLTWFFTWKDNQKANTIFLILLSVLFLGQIGYLYHASTLRYDLKAAAKMRESIAEIKGVQEQEKALKKYRNTVMNDMSKIVGTSEGYRKKFYTVAQQIANTTAEKQREFENAVDKVYADDILSPLFLDNQDSFLEQREIINHYITQARIYKQYHQELPALIKEKFSHLSYDEKVNQALLAKLENETKPRIEVMISSLNQHIENGQYMLELLEFLEQHFGEWAYHQQAGVQFKDKHLQSQYQLIHQKLSESEQALEKLFSQYYTLSMQRDTHSKKSIAP